MGGQRERITAGRFSTFAGRLTIKKALGKTGRFLVSPKKQRDILIEQVVL
jgi:hypothetical protein